MGGNAPYASGCIRRVFRPVIAVEAITITGTSIGTALNTNEKNLLGEYMDVYKKATLQAIIMHES